MEVMPVVAGVDGSQESLRAAGWAAHEAQRHGAPLRLVSAALPPPHGHARNTGPQTVAEELSGESARALSEAVIRTEEASPRLLIDACLLDGPSAIAVTGNGAGALMLVVGARGAGGFAAMLLGSVSRYTAMHASCPVVVVREGTDARHLEVVVGIRDPQDAAALAFAFGEANLRGATVVAVHSWNGLTAATWRPADPARLVAEADRNLAEALRPWRDRYPAVPVRQDVVHDHPGRVLTSYSSRADLVVIGRHGRGGGPAVGGILHAVLSHASGTVAIVPSG